MVDGEVGVGKWHLTRFYGNLDTRKRPESWPKLKHLKGTLNLPWLTIGDFNELTSLLEREGGSTRPRQQMQNFLDTISFCGFREVDYIGPKFTWIYQKADGSQIRERLDRALATPKWLALFPIAKLFHLTSLASDHSPLALRMVKKSHKRRQKKMFRFEAMWLKDQRCEGVVQVAWEEGLSLGADYTLGKCMEICWTGLEGWNKTDFGHVGRKISDLQKCLEWIELQPTTLDIVQLMRNTRIELNGWPDKEDAMWRQRSRLTWFQEGDRNTRFFHTKASARYKKNLIDGLMDSNGVWQEEEQIIEEIVVDYFKNLFTTSSLTNFNDILEAVETKVSPSMNHMLTSDFTTREVEQALKQMHPQKALGPDGMPPLFFQHFWSISGDVVTKMVLDFLNLGVFPPNFNETHIVLIPKINDPKLLTKIA